jgi:hypothetical protein
MTRFAIMLLERRPDPDGSPESLGARLRALPQLPVPADLEDRLLAAIPAEMPVERRCRAVWVGAIGALAAACLLIVLIWSRPAGRSPGTSRSAPQVALRPPDDSAGHSSWLEARRSRDGAEIPKFTWPLDNSLTSVISPDLFE